MYTLNGQNEVYVGESLNAAARLKQHIAAGRSHLRVVRVLIDSTFNKSVCLDLESFLIRMFAGDGKFAVTNLNEGITNADYYNRHLYQETFDEIFNRLKDSGLFTRTIPQIENSDLFKLSPFKALTSDQAGAVNDILEGLFKDMETETSSVIAIKGEPGTGKTIVAIYLMKLLRDIQLRRDRGVIDSDSIFAEYFIEGYAELLAGLRLGLVVPQQSLRQSIRKVFSKTPGLDATMVLSPFEAALSTEQFDLLIVDETHRLSQRANQSSGVRNKQFQQINEKLFGEDNYDLTQLDWLQAVSRHLILLIDSEQTVRPSDLPTEQLGRVLDTARTEGRIYQLLSQMRVNAGDDYVAYIRRIFDTETAALPRLKNYEFILFDDFKRMKDHIERKNKQFGLSRLVAGYAWPWSSKKNRELFDIEIEGSRLRWNSTDKDWINSPNSKNEVGSIHTVQGYDLNYAGVIIGPELKFDKNLQRIVFDRSNYFDKKGKENNPRLGINYTDADLLQYVKNIYAVLMTRGMRGTFVYVCDPELRSFLQSRIPTTIQVDQDRSLRM
ncbi:hypothetical protein GCM10011512_09710 [Tersicoccus solisilvae]|uniref:AAA+ ATPase domain-containing protein n=1 Tax=Tersicoccus solisilvae TaxID=1882339 RepID=A0ABQ1NTS2_9MICC|nr:DNA/RNA helicase domain-containing protein [Tersicoccus solisilvae]GGC84914.1 hypothetical protein GCM10011512_09710 [Tersicoccus solisilvae]